MSDNLLGEVVDKAADSVGDGLGKNTLAAFMRFLGWGIDKTKQKLIGGRKGEAQIEPEVALQNALNQNAVDLLKDDPVLNAMAVEDLRKKKTVGHYLNKAGVAQETVKELNHKAASESQENMQQDIKRPSEEFMEEFEPYAEKASTAELKKLWGKVLAAEISTPGSVSKKAMRIVNELDRGIAELFQKICEHRIGDAIPVCLSGELEFLQQKQLENAGLINSAGTIRLFQETKVRDGNEIWLAVFGMEGVSISKNAKLTSPIMKETDPIRWSGTGKPDGILCYMLTEAGEAIASIFEDKQAKAFHAYLRKLSEALSEIEVTEWHETGVQGDEKIASLVRVWKAGKPVREA